VLICVLIVDVLTVVSCHVVNINVHSNQMLFIIPFPLDPIPISMPTSSVNSVQIVVDYVRDTGVRGLTRGFTTLPHPKVHSP